jgi:hypothetical protein
MLFDARAKRDLTLLLSLLSPDLQAETFADGEVVAGRDGARSYLDLRTGQDAGCRTEVQAHRLLIEGDDVIAVGRIRVFEDGTLSDSPAAWRFTVKNGLVERIAPCPVAAPPVLA